MQPVLNLFSICLCKDKRSTPGCLNFALTPMRGQHTSLRMGIRSLEEMPELVRDGSTEQTCHVNVRKGRDFIDPAAEDGAPGSRLIAVECVSHFFRLQC